MSHTPGPWEVEIHANGCVFITSPNTSSSGGDIADLYHTILDAFDGQQIVTKQNAEANAHLIAAAPDLLEACEEAVEQLWHLAKDKQTNPWVKQLRAAIAKAKGEAE